MTRLIDEWIKNISTTIKNNEDELFLKTGLNYITLASLASGVPKEKIDFASKNIKIGVVPITAGLGIISTFSQSVVAILKCMNFEAFLTDDTDVAGIYEATQKGAKIIFFADDSKFLAVNLEKNIVAENSIATARGFVTALEGAVGNLKEREVLVTGCGVVGQEMMQCLKQKQAVPIVYDTNQDVLNSLVKKGYRAIDDVKKLVEYDAILDATNSGGWLSKNMIHPKVWIASPGVPISLDDEAYAMYKDRIIHDYLPIGVATMLATACGENNDIRRTI